MTDQEFLLWIHDRLAFVHKENELLDYMWKLRAIIRDLPHDQITSNIFQGKSSSEELKELLNL